MSVTANTGLVAFRNNARVICSQLIATDIYRALLSFEVDGTALQFNGVDVKLYFIARENSGTLSGYFDTEPILERAFVVKQKNLNAGIPLAFGQLATVSPRVTTYNLLSVEGTINYTELSSATVPISEVASSVTPDTYTAVYANVAFDRTEAQSLADYDPDGGAWGSVKFLTSQPQYLDIELTDSAFLAAINGATRSFTHCNITTYNASLVKISNGVIELESPLAGYHYTQAGIGAKQINALASGDFVIGSQQTISNSTPYYSISFGTASGGTYTRRTEERYFRVVQPCISQTRLHFVNKFGAVDSYTFNLRSERRAITDFERFERRSASATPSASPSDVMQNRFNITQRKQFDLFSALVTAQERDWLNQLLSSPMVCREVSIGGALTYIPVEITDTDQTPVFEPINGFDFALSIIDSQTNSTPVVW